MTDEIKSTDLKQEPTLLEKTQKVVEELRQQLDRKEELLKREEAVKARDILGGRSDAGTTEPVKPVESAADYAKRVMQGK